MQEENVAIARVQAVFYHGETEFHAPIQANRRAPRRAGLAAFGVDSGQARCWLSSTIYNALMNNPPVKFERVAYESLNARQKENFNFQQVSAVLADYGFATLRLSDDWQGADFIANHVDGERSLKVQLKSRLTVKTKYKNKEIWICFRYRNIWYLFLHDAFLRWALKNTNIGYTNDWVNPTEWDKVQGVYSWPRPSKEVLSWFNENSLTIHPTVPV